MQTSIAFDGLPIYNPSVKTFFRRLSPAVRTQWKQHYERLIDIEEGRIIEQKKEQFTRMPWMLNSWKEGLRILNEVITETDQLKP